MKLWRKKNDACVLTFCSIYYSRSNIQENFGCHLLCRQTHHHHDHHLYTCLVNARPPLPASGLVLFIAHTHTHTHRKHIHTRCLICLLYVIWFLFFPFLFLVIVNVCVCNVCVISQYTWWLFVGDDCWCWRHSFFSFRFCCYA